MASEHDRPTLLEKVEGLAEHTELRDFAEDLRLAFSHIGKDPKSCLVKCRMCTERVILALYAQIQETPPQKGDPLDNAHICKLIPQKTERTLREVRLIGNKGPHPNDELFTPEEAERTLDKTCDVLAWYSEYVDLRKRPSRALPSIRRKKRWWSAWALGGLALVVSVVLLARGFATNAFSKLVQGWLDEIPNPDGPDGIEKTVFSSNGADFGQKRADFALSSRDFGPIGPDLAKSAVLDEAKCSEQQSGTGNDLFAVLAGSNKEVVVVGAAGTMLHTNDLGNTWTRIPNDTQADLHAVTRIPKQGVLAVGSGGTIVFVPQPSEQADFGPPTETTPDAARKTTLLSLLSVGQDEVLISGEKGTLFYYHLRNGTNAPVSPRDPLSPIPQTVDLRALARLGDRVFAVGSQGTLIEIERNDTAWVAHALRHKELRPTDDYFHVTALEKNSSLLLLGAEGQGSTSHGIAISAKQNQDETWDIKHRSFAPENSPPLLSYVQLESPLGVASGQGFFGFWRTDVIQHGTRVWKKEELSPMPTDASASERFRVGGNEQTGLFFVGEKGRILHRSARLPQ